MAKLKPYIMSNYNGSNAAMVVAATLTAAAKKLRTSPYTMRQYGWHIGTPDDLSAAADPEAIYYRPIDNGLGYPWSPLQYERDHTAGIGCWRVKSAA
jgi:hypothetical protein